MQQTIKLSQEIAPHYHNTFLSMKMHQADEGGRGCTKTSKNALRVSWTAMTEQCAIVVMRKHTNKIRRSVFKEVLRAFNRLGVNNKLLKFTTSPFEITYIPTGSKIYFTGIESIDDIKGMIDEDMPIKLIWLEELTQFKDEYEVLHIIATFSRGNNDWFIVLYSWNAPEDSYHWIFDWVKKMEKRDDFLHTNETYLTVPKEWLGKMFIMEAEAVKQMDIDMYDHIYLNKPMRLTGLIYKKWNESFNVVDDNECKKIQYQKFSIGVDYGETDATSFTLRGHADNFHTERLLRHYYHKNGVTAKVEGLPFIKATSKEKQIDDYIEDFLTCAEYWKNEFQIKSIDLFIDTANKSFKELLKKTAAKRNINYLRFKQLYKRPNETENNAIEERITIYNYMLISGVEKVSNHKSTLEIRKAISRCKRGDTGQFKGKRIDNGTQNIDSLDSNEYSFIMFYNFIKNAVVLEMNKKEKEE